ncbi:Mitochondrial carrier protein ymc2 [Physocladia obscura]|uniref:Mitochondrial carrier protein ymc2 n=1 Tax=Physocladia obscura TaxID=109957 RepID=A0AAD5XB75_9FUNG|nr:Mitochondrial carrier protein ymc2 [Physocladia obscura]
MARQKTSNRSDVSSTLKFLYGAASGYIFWVTIYPVDVIKSRVQTDGFKGTLDQKYKGSFDCARKIVVADGLKGLYRGFWTCMARAGPVNGIVFVSFETAMKVTE